MKYPGDYGALIADPFTSGGGWHVSPELRWQRYAACAQPTAPTRRVAEEANRFFPGGGRPTVVKRALCLACTVREECLDFAMTNHEQGMWGGLTEEERRTLERPVRKGTK